MISDVRNISDSVRKIFLDLHLNFVVNLVEYTCDGNF